MSSETPSRPAPYLSADALRITPEEREGLIALVEYFRRPQVVHIKDLYREAPDDLVVTGDHRIGFNMRIIALVASFEDEYDCGCAACIGGHLALYLQGVPFLTMDRALTDKTYLHQTAKAGKYVDGRHKLSPLFFPLSLMDWGQIKPATAATAIENLLRTGDPSWPAAAAANGQSDLIKAF